MDFVALDLDDRSLNDVRQQLGITAQAQYLLVNADGEIVARWFGVIDQARVETEIETWLQT